jgi:steroid delta-isomerase-like uncharacterized protein
MSSREELVELTRQWISLWSAPVDWALFEKIHASEFMDMSSAGRGTTKADFAAGIRRLVQAFPDLTTKVEDVIVDEGAHKVAVRWSALGTNRLNYLGIGPTNRLTRINGIEVVKIGQGVIVSRWGEWDISDHHD